MKKLLIALVLLISVQCSWGACSGLTNSQYNTEILKMLNKSIEPVDIETAKGTRWASRWKKKIVRYRQDGGGPGSIEDIASRCLAKDLIEDLAGTGFSSHGGDLIDWYQNHVKDEYEN